MGNTGISRGTGNKGKSPSHLQISFPTKKLPSALNISNVCISQKIRIVLKYS